MERHTEEFEKTIAAMLNQEALQDPLFAEKLKKEGKTMSECCEYIIGEVEKSGRCGFADSEMLCMAKHYWDEDGIKPDTHGPCKVVVNHEIQLTEEEKAEAKREAMERLISENKRRMEERSRKPSKTQNVTSNQTSLFDL